MTILSPLTTAKIISISISLVLFFIIGVAPTTAQKLNLTAVNNDVNIVEHLVIVEDGNFDVYDVAARKQAEQKALGIPIADQIIPEATADGDWAYIRIENATNQPIARVLDTEHFINKDYVIYLEQTDELKLVLDAELPAQAIEDRVRPELVLASNPINILPQGEIGLWVHFKTGDNAGLVPIYLRAEAVLTEHRTKNSNINSIFYGISFTLLIFLALLSFLLNSRPARYYLVFLIGTIALNMQQDGYFSLFFYAGDPSSNTFIRLFWQVIMVLSYQFFMISFLDVRHRFPRFFVLTTIFIAFVLTFFAVYPIWGTTEIYRYGINALALMFTAISIGAAYLAFKSRPNGSGFFILGIVIFISYLTYSVANNFLWQYSYVFEVIRNVKILQLLDASVFTAAMLSQTFGLRKQRDKALQSELATAQENLEIAQSLLAANKDRDRAKALAERHQNKLADVSHDMRQPLTSLQLALEQADKSSPELKEKLEAGLSYLNSVLGNTLDEIHPSKHREDDVETKTDHVPLQIVFDNLNRMFGSEAKEKGLKLHFDKSALVVEADAIELIRMLSNLVSNAIKYTDSGDVKVSCSNRGETVSIAVKDTGNGMTEQDLAHAMKRHQRGTNDVDGKGLGLNIVSTIAQRSGLMFEAQSKISKGSVFTISEIPKASG